MESYSKNSLLDEPEISFISFKTNSNVNSPMKDQISTPAPRLIDSRNNNRTQASNVQQNFASYLLHKNELFKRFSNISPIEPHQANSLHSSNDSSSSANSLKQQQQQQQRPSETPIGTQENKSVLFKSLNKSEATPQHQFQSLIAEKTSMFTNETPHSSIDGKKVRKNHFDSYLSAGCIEQANFQSSANHSNFKTLSPSKTNDDSHMTIQYENDHMIQDESCNNSRRQSSIIEFSQMDNLINWDRNFLQTPASFFNEDKATGSNYGHSESLLSFERHEMSNAEMISSSSKKSTKSPYVLEETLEFDESEESSLKYEPKKSSKSPVNNKAKSRVDQIQKQKVQPKSFKSQNLVPKTSDLSPCMQKQLKSSFENSNSKIDDSSVTQVTLLNNHNFDKTVS